MIDLNNPKQRGLLPYALARLLTEELKTTLLYYLQPQRLELCEFVVEATLLMERLYKEPSEGQTIMEYYLSKEQELCKRFGRQYQAFERLELLRFFDRQEVTLEAGWIPDEDWKLLPEENRSLNVEEFGQYMQMSRELLRLHLKELYHLQPAVWETRSKMDAKSDESEEAAKESTRARQLLMIYSLLKAGFGISRQNTDITDMARFAHQLLGVKLNSLDSSDIYKKYKKLPELKKGLYLLEDLRFVREAFKAIGAEAALKLLDELTTEELRKLSDKG